MKLKENTILKNGEYRIIRTLGQGGFGITYLAQQTDLYRNVVIKEFFIKDHCERDNATRRVSLGTSGSREMIERFREKFVKEARNIAAFDHPNIVRVIGVFEENNTAYYVMEYHSAGSLGSLVDNRGALNEDDALYYIRQVASALKYVHSRKMMHLDIKPDNILVNSRGEAVLIDFGLSKRYDEKGKATSTTPIGISHGYAPMEQYNPGGVGEFSPAIDIYSLGATLFTLLTGEMPPPALQLVDSRSLQGDLAAKNVSGAVAEAVIKSMSFMKEARPQSVDEFLALLDAQPATGNSAPFSSNTLNSGTVSRSADEKNGNNGASRLVAPMNNDSAEVSRSAARTVNSGTVSRSADEKNGNNGASRLIAPMDNDSAEVSRSAARTVNSGTVSRSVEEKGSGVSRPIAPMNNNGAATADNEPKKPFNWKIPVGIVAAILCVVFAGVGINNCNDERAEQERLAIIEKTRRDSIANLPGKLYVTTTPAGATVTVDGRRIGTTPINAYELKKGNYTVKIGKEGYSTYTKSITISADPVIINETLTAKPVEQKAASKPSTVDVAKCYNDGVEAYNAKNYTEAVRLYRIAAEQGYADAQNYLGYCCERGLGVEKDPKEAVKWYRKAAEQGQVNAQYNLGICYEYEKGVAKDPTEAVKWYRKAAEQGYADAQNNLGYCYENGLGVEKDPKEAVKWYRKAAEQGHAHAQHNLGICYEYEIGVGKKPTEAVKWYKKAAEQGHARAQNNLGYCYANGLGVEKDPKEAVKWYRKAAEQGHALAQWNLGYRYEKGLGVEKNLTEAVKWYKKAAEQGDADAKAALQRLNQ